MTFVEEPSSNLTRARGMPNGNPAFGIKAKLFLAFLGMAMLTGIASIVAWYVFADIDSSVARITAESIVDMAASLRLAEKSAEIAATAPALIASRNEEDRVQQQGRIVQTLKELSTVTKRLKDTGVGEVRLANLIEIEGKIATELKALNGAVEQRLRLASQESTVADLAALHTRLQEVLEPLVDDAGFNLVTRARRRRPRARRRSQIWWRAE